MEALAGRNAVVVGGGQGIGRGIALALAKESMNVAVLDIEAAAAERTAAEIGALGVRSIGIRTDVTNLDHLGAAARDVTHALGPVHVLSNNAGVVVPQGPITEKKPRDWEYVFSVNVFGIVNCVQTFLPVIRAHGHGGHIVNTSSTAGLVSIHDLEVGVYTASKYACNGYSEILRGELAAENIGVSVLCPGLIDTELSQTSARNRPDRFGGASPVPNTLTHPSRMSPRPNGQRSDNATYPNASTSPGTANGSMHIASSKFRPNAVVRTIRDRH